MLLSDVSDKLVTRCTDSTGSTCTWDLNDLIQAGVTDTLAGKVARIQYTCLCGAGFLPNPVGGACIPCAAGEYRTLDMATCVQCPVGSYSLSIGAVSTQDGCSWGVDDHRGSIIHQVKGRGKHAYSAVCFESWHHGHLPISFYVHYML